MKRTAHFPFWRVLPIAQLVLCGVLLWLLSSVFVLRLCSAVPRGFVGLAQRASTPKGTQESGQLQEPLTVNGIKLGELYDHVLAELGKPLKEKRTVNREVPVSNTEWNRLLEYDGASIELASGKKAGPFDVVSITIFGGRWKLSHGLRLGMTDRDVIKILGPAKESASNTSEQSTSLWYLCSDKNGWAKFDFSKGHLKKVYWFIDLS